MCETLDQVLEVLSHLRMDNVSGVANQSTYQIQGMHKQSVHFHFGHMRTGSPQLEVDSIYWHGVFKQESFIILASVGVRAKTKELLSAGTRLEEYGVFLTSFAIGLVIPSSLPPPTVARRLDNFCNSQNLSEPRAISIACMLAQTEVTISGSFGTGKALECKAY